MGAAAIHTLPFQLGFGERVIQGAVSIGLFAEFFLNQQQPLEGNSRYGMYLPPALTVLPKVKPRM